jgi:hypothetical protein
MTQQPRIKETAGTGFDLMDLTKKLYRYGRYLYALSSFIGFIFILLNSPQRLAVLLRFAGLSYTTIFSHSSFKALCHAIENTAIASNRRRHNSIIVPYLGKLEQNKDWRHGERKQDEGKGNEGKEDEGKQEEGKQDEAKHINGKLQYAMNDDTLIRWYCKCHSLKPLSLSICPRGD